MIQREHQGLRWYQGEGLSSGCCHGFPTRLGGHSQGIFQSLNLATGRGDEEESVTKNYQAIINARHIQPTGFARNAQVHGTTIHKITHENALSFSEFTSPTGNVPTGDGLLTQEKGIMLWVYGADCVPVLCYDPVTESIGAVHGGWRGTMAGISYALIQSMVKEYGSDPSHIQVVLGPSIGPCCFMCSSDVPDAMLDALGEEVRPYIPEHPSVPQKFAVDLWGIHELWLKKAGVTHIEANPPCTACHPEEFWSHRTQGEERGALGGYIYLGEHS